MQDVFLPLTDILRNLVVVPAAAAYIADMSMDVRQMEAVAQIVLRKVDTESKYLARLEGKALVTSVVVTSRTLIFSKGTDGSMQHIAEV